MTGSREERLEKIRERITAAAARAGRSPGEITLIAVSKTFPESAIREVASLGQVDFGENKVQEFASKVDSLGRGEKGSPLKWHFIGHLQRNKAKELIGRADLFHALDSERLGGELQKRLEVANSRLNCLVQVNVSGEQSKFGVEPEELDALLDDLKTFDRIRLKGLMTLASPAETADKVRPELALLRRLSERISDRLECPHPILSMGMSGDYEGAIEEGATHVRIGSAIFGQR